MLHKDFFAALAMSAIIIPFGIYLQELEETSRTFPEIMLILMIIFNILQYALAVLQRGIGISRGSAANYPLGRVLLLLGLTILYVFSLQDVGFYVASLAYFVAATLLAQPDAVTLRTLGLRILCCGIFVGFLYMLFTVLLGVQIPKGFTGI